MKDKVLALDMGGTNLRAAIISEDLKIVRQIKDATISDNPPLLLKKAIEFAKEVSKEYLDEIRGIGVSICGVVKDNVIGKCGNLSILGNFPLYDALKKEFVGIDNIRIANDANCSALFESRFGSNKDVKDSIFITISTGIGGGLVINTQMIDASFEVGRQIIEYDHEFYEAEHLLSGNGLVVLCEKNELYVKNAKEFFDLYRSGDNLAKRVYEKWIKRLSLFFSNLQLLFNVQRYSVSGGVMKSRELFLNDLEKISNASISSFKLNPIKIVVPQFDQDIGVMGASSLVL